MTTSSSPRLRFLLLALACHFAVAIGVAAAPAATLRIEELSGQATWIRADQPATSLYQGISITFEGVLSTGPNSRLLFRLPDDTLVSLGANSEIELLGYRQPPSTDTAETSVHDTNITSQTELKIRRGILTNHVRKLRTGAAYKIHTPLGVAGVRGTTFQVRISEITQNSIVGINGSLSENQIQIVTLATTEGLVAFDANSGLTQDVAAGYALIAGDPADARKDGAPVLRLRLLSQREINDINKAVNQNPASPQTIRVRSISTGTQPAAYNIKPAGTRIQK